MGNLVVNVMQHQFQFSKTKVATFLMKQLPNCLHNIGFRYHNLIYIFIGYGEESDLKHVEHTNHYTTDAVLYSTCTHFNVEKLVFIAILHTDYRVFHK